MSLAFRQTGEIMLACNDLSVKTACIALQLRAFAYTWSQSEVVLLETFVWLKDTKRERSDNLVADPG